MFYTTESPVPVSSAVSLYEGESCSIASVELLVTAAKQIINV